MRTQTQLLRWPNHYDIFMPFRFENHPFICTSHPMFRTSAYSLKTGWYHRVIWLLVVSSPSRAADQKLSLSQECISPPLDCLVHPLCNSILLWTVRARVFPPTAELSVEYDEFIRFVFSHVFKSQILQLLIRLILDHSKPILENKKKPVFGVGQVCPDLPIGVIDEGHKIKCITKRLVRHRISYIRMY